MFESGGRERGVEKGLEQLRDADGIHRNADFRLQIAEVEVRSSPFGAIAARAGCRQLIRGELTLRYGHHIATAILAFRNCCRAPGICVGNFSLRTAVVTGSGNEMHDFRALLKSARGA